MENPGASFDRLLMWARRHVVAVDVAWAVAWTGLALLFQPPFDMTPAMEAWWLALAVAMGVALTMRRTRPRLVIAALGVLMVIHLLVLDVFTMLSVIATGAAAYTAHALLGRRERRLVTAVVAMGTTWAALNYAQDIVQLAWWQRWPVVLVHWLIVAVFCLLGALARKRREELARAVERAELVAQGQAQEVRLATLGERTHIAREMHDIVAHSLGVIIAQADGGRYAAAADPAAAVRSLETIANLGRTSLAEMRELLSVLRHDDTRDFVPAPSLADLDELAEDYRKAGLRVRLTETGTPVPLPDTMALTVYRVVQESLANALKHGGRTTVDVRLTWPDGPPHALVITARNPLADPNPGADLDREASPPGHGLVGMRERVTLHGGTLTVGPESGLWHVRAEIPLASERPGS
ncbi:MAG: histidine kinase [Propionibacteriaceae bacterium]|nr:histidine kinase [Propionibacteriaceae bacterium]